VVTAAFSGLATWGLLVLTDWVVGLRVTTEQEREGLDLTLHGEQVF
jgi:Amt family ammonium transporter